MPSEKSNTVPSFGMIPMSPAQLDTSRKEIVFWEEGNPRCVVNLLQRAEKMRDSIMNLPPHYLTMTDHELEKMVEPTAVDEELRLAFWDEYFVACDNDSQMRVQSVHSRTCTREYFYRFVVENPKRLAYMMRPPREYMLRMRSLLEMGLKRFEEIMSLPIKETKMIRGSQVEVVNTKLIGEIVKIVTIIDNRVKGAVAQKLIVDQTSKNMHLHANYEPPKTVAEIEAELKSVQKEILELSTPKSQPLEKVMFEGFTDDERETVEVAASPGGEEET